MADMADSEQVKVKLENVESVDLEDFSEETLKAMKALIESQVFALFFLLYSIVKGSSVKIVKRRSSI